MTVSRMIHLVMILGKKDKYKEAQENSASFKL